MTTYAFERLDVRPGSSSRGRTSPTFETGWSPLLPAEETRTSRGPQRTASCRRDQTQDRASRPFWGDGVYRGFEEHQRWEDEYRQANALGPRVRSYNPRAQSADTRGLNGNEHRSSRAFNPEPTARFLGRPSFTPERLRFEELRDQLQELDTEGRSASDDDSNDDEYEAPPTLLGQAQDCMTSLARAAHRARAFVKEGCTPLITVIPGRCEDSLFRLKVWVAETKIERMPATGQSELDNEVINLASSILYRLHRRISSLAGKVERGTKSASSFSFAEPPQENVIEDDRSDYEDSTLPLERLTALPSMEQDLSQIELQIRTLRRLARSLRVVQGDEVSVGVMKHVSEVSQLFGTKAECDKWAEEVRGMPPDAALRTVKELVGACA